MFKFTIDRRFWFRGRADSYLVVPPFASGDPADRECIGKKCCLGFYLEACGVKLAEMVGVGQPSDLLLEEIPEAARWLVNQGDLGTHSDSGDCTTLMYDNDQSHRELDDELREQKISETFARHGIEVEFKN